MPHINSLKIIEPFISRFDTTVKKCPASIALKINQRQVSYIELQQRAFSFASCLEKYLDAEVDGIILYLTRSEDLIIALLACQYLGKLYVPVDIRTSKSRLEKIVKASRYLVLYEEKIAHSVHPLWLDLNVLKKQMSPCSAFNINTRHSEEAYRIYTSGSTGEPKGVQVLNRGCANLIQSFSQLLTAGSQSHWLSATSISFDIFYLEYTIPLSYGATLILLDDIQMRSPQEIARQLVHHQPQVFQATPSMFKSLLPYLPETFHFSQLLVGGEALSQQLSAQLFSRCRWLCNVYGPTETTVWSSAHVIVKPGDIRIGKPIDNTVINILDDEDQPVSTQTAGRIFIGGKGLATGYFNNRKLTAEKFLTFEYEGKSSVFYDTGDIGFYDAEGILNYLNRADDFIKINGYRVEISEIVDALEKIPSVHQAAVVLLANEIDQEGKLVGWLKTDENSDVADVLTIRSHLEQQLNHYMIPHYLFLTTQLPSAMSGKLDSKMLIKMSEEKLQHAAAGKVSTQAPAKVSVVDHPAMEILRNYIGSNDLSVDSNFFHYGLSSMQAISFHLQLIILYPQIELHELFARPTLLSLLAPYDKAFEN